MQAKIWNFSQWIQETNPQKIKERFDAALLRSGFNVLCFIDHHFELQGYSALWLLAESHFAVHTFPECDKAYIELSSCNLEFYQEFLQLTKELR